MFDCINVDEEQQMPQHVHIEGDTEETAKMIEVDMCIYIYIYIHTIYYSMT